MKKICTALLIASLVSGCATSSKNVSTTYVSPLQYKDYSCSQITMEMMRMSSRVNELGGRLDQAASNDAAITGVGIILFWPILFALGGTKQQEAEYARMKGEYEALTQLAMTKNCLSESAPTPPMNTPTPAVPIIDGTSGGKLSLDEAAKKCTTLGFKAGTEQFGQCALVLSK